MKSIWLFLFLFCSTIQAAKENVKREIKEDEIEESESIDEEEVEGSGSIPVQKIRDLDVDDKISMYAALYRKSVVENKDLDICPQQCPSLYKVCQFFNAGKKSGKLTGNPETDAHLTKEGYAAIKKRLPPSYWGSVPKHKSILKAIIEEQKKLKDGERLLKPFLELRPETLGGEQKISSYAALYEKIVEKNEDLNVSLRQNVPLSAVCQFFKAGKKSGKLTGNPETDALLTKEGYAAIKKRLPKNHSNGLPKYELIVTAIREKQDRQEERGGLFERFLEARPAKINEGEAEGSVQQFNLRNLGVEQRISICAALYEKIVKKNEDLNVSLEQSVPLSAACQFFKAGKKSGKLTGNPADDAHLTKEGYAAIKKRFPISYWGSLPKYASIVKVIKNAKDRPEEGEGLLERFLEARPAKINEGEAEGSVQQFNSRNLEVEQKISIYAALYEKIVKKSEDLNVSLAQSLPLSAACQFFKAGKKSGKLTGNPETDARLTEEDYTEIKKRLSKTCSSVLPKYELIVKAIIEEQDRQGEGEGLFERFLEARPAKINEGEAEGSVQQFDLRNLEVEQRISIYAALYEKIVKKNEDLYVSPEQSALLFAVCQFFNAGKELKIFKGNPEDDARLTEEDYTEIKKHLSKTYRSYVPKLDRLVKAIIEEQDRQGEGEGLLERYLEARPAKINEGEAEGSVQQFNLRNLGGEQRISLCAALYEKIVKKNENLNVSPEQSAPLSAACQFFKAGKELKIFKGNPEDDAHLTKEGYAEIKRRLPASYWSSVPKRKSILIKAIREAQDRQGEGEGLLERFLEARPAKIKEGEIEGSVRKALTKNQRISIYAALYMKKIVENKDLDVTLQENRFLYVACKFFNEGKNLKIFKGNPEDVACLKKQAYTAIKKCIPESYWSSIPKHKSIVKAIGGAEARQEEGERVLERFLEVRPAKINEGAVEGSGSIPVPRLNRNEEPESFFYEEESSSVKIKDQPGYILKKEAELDQIQ